MDTLRIDFDGRNAMAEYLRSRFPDAVGPVSPFVGGPAAALDRLADIDPAAYARTRNHVGGAVTRLSPYLRHGCVTTAEVRDAARRKAGRAANKLVQELGWHDYFRRVLRVTGDAWQTLGPPTAGHDLSDYADSLPDDIERGETGVDWVDYFARELAETGWLHNHARLWLAAYVVHGRRVAWQAGARWFLRHLVDGDPASNNLSWQWVAGTFAAKPYLTTRQAILHNAQDMGWPRHGRNDPFDADLHAVTDRLLGTGTPAEAPDGVPDLSAVHETRPPQPPTATGNGVVWLHDEMLGPRHPAHDGSPAVYVVDDGHVAGRTLKPLAFVWECLAEIHQSCPVTVLRSNAFGGAVAAAVVAFARRHGAGRVRTGPSHDPRNQDVLGRLAGELVAEVRDVEPFVELDGPVDLRRFSRYWRKAEKALS